MDIRQSSLYANYMEKLGWKVKKIANFNVFIRRFPLYGIFAKLQRITSSITFQEIKDFIKQNRIRRIIIEPDMPANENVLKHFFAHGLKINNSPYLPTKTIIIDLKKSTEELFKSFAEAKRRAIRKAIKNNVVIEESRNIKDFISLKNRYFPMLGFLFSRDIEKLWQTFSPRHTNLLLAKYKNSYVAGILLLHYQNQSYYWHAASNKLGNKLAAPSLLVWEALKLSKKLGSSIFDFEGIYDSRFHQATKSWLGFTKFKQGFGGREIEYVGSFYI